MSDGRGDFRPLTNLEIGDADDAFDDEEMEYGYYERRRKGYGAMRSASRQRMSWTSILCTSSMVLIIAVVVLYFLSTGSSIDKSNNDSNLEEDPSNNNNNNNPQSSNPDEENGGADHQHTDSTTVPVPVMHCGGDIDVSGASWSEFKQIEESKTEWCRPGHKDCDCSNPSEKAPLRDNDWKDTFERNKQLVHASLEDSRPLDLVFFGDVEVEQWLGTKIGEPAPELEANKRIYEQLFRDDDALVHGLFLGIGGDTCSHLRYRINNGEISNDEKFQPSQMWINIGTGDLFRDSCTPEAVLACIMEVVESIQQLRPNAHIVLHSVTPRGYEEIADNHFMEHITPLNRLIECYASSQASVTWFDATDLFLTDDGSKINSTLFDADFLHISGEGSIVWGEAIVAKSMELAGRGVPDPDAFANVTLGTSLEPVGEKTCKDDYIGNKDWSSWKVFQSRDGDRCEKDHPNCSCENPIEPGPHKLFLEKWKAASKRNKKLAKESLKDERDLDFIMMGDSIVEHWLGTDLAYPLDTWFGNYVVYNQLFNDTRSPVHGLPLGIGGDRTPQLLKRIEDELPDSLEAPVFILLVGTNDAFGDRCSVNTTVAGIVASAEKILELAPNSRVLLHSILVRGEGNLFDPSPHTAWKAISEMNDRLSCFASGNDNIEFFNASDYFIMDDKRSVDSAMFEDGLHPNAIGSICWGIGIVQKISEMLGRDAPMPDFFNYTCPFRGSSCEASFFNSHFLVAQDWNTWKDHLGEWIQGEDLCSRPDPCHCQNPIEASGLLDNANWNRSLARNFDLAKASLVDQRPLDFVMMGDSIVEHWLGTDRSNINSNWESNFEIYQKLFRDEESPVHGLTLGIGGDRTPHMLYRLIHEIPGDFNPPIWFILVGTNDLFGDFCTVDATLAGIIEITERVLQMTSNTTVVLHSILPRGGKSELDLDQFFWGPISELNDNLQCYASSKDRVRFWNATDFFTFDDNMTMDDHLFEERPGHLHPSGAGHIDWGLGMIREVLDILGREAPGPDFFDEWSNELKASIAPKVCNESSCEAIVQDTRAWVEEQASLEGEALCCNQECLCNNASAPLPGPHEWWPNTTARNEQLIYETLNDKRPLDFVLIGDSIVEHWLGTDLGHEFSHLEGHKEVYEELFRSDSSPVHGLALGIGGDTTPQILYRLEHEIKASLDAPVLILLVGTNDVIPHHCSPDTVLSGIITIAEKLSEIYPQSTILLHSILPRTDKDSPQPDLLGNNKEWPMISALNNGIACFTTIKENMYWFNATDVFLEDDGRSIDASMFQPDRVHPSPKGHRCWGEALMTEVLGLLGRDDSFNATCPEDNENRYYHE